MKTDFFQSCGHWWVFQICWHIECSTFTASSVRIWNSSSGILSPPLALFVVMLLRPIWLHIPGRLALGEWSHHCDYLAHEDLFCTVLCILATSSFIIYAGVDYHFLLQEIFLTQGLNPGLQHCRQTLYCLSHHWSPFSRLLRAKCWIMNKWGGGGARDTEYKTIKKTHKFPEIPEILEVK